MMNGNLEMICEGSRLVYAANVSPDFSSSFRLHPSSFLNNHMPGERGRICHNHAIADYAIVRDVSLGHDQTIIAYLSQHPPARGATMNCHKFPNQIAPANARFRRLAFVL